MKRMKLKRFLVLVILIIVTLTSFNCFGTDLNNPTNENNYDKIEYVDSYNILANYNGKADSIIYNVINKQKNDIRNQIVAEVKRYIKKQSPTANKNIPEHLVIKCLENNLDICFAMSQTQVETNFGTTGAGRSTSRRSMFGVAIRKYPSYESAINDYIAILKKSYLVKGRTEQHLMKNYVNGSGGRYASSTNYEKHLFEAYNNIKAQTNIYKLQKHYYSM